MHNERRVATNAECTTSLNTECYANRHPDNPAGGTLGTRLRGGVVKRSYSNCSPAHSPGKRSPLPKRHRRIRTGTEGANSNKTNQPITSGEANQLEIQHQSHLVRSPKCLQDFQLTDLDKKVLLKVKEVCTQYILLKVAACEQNKTLTDLQTYFTLSTNTSIPECSNIVYFTVLDQRCDDKNTLLKIITDLYDEFIHTKKKKRIILGDQATYERLKSIKAEYGNDLDWMIVFPGDWHKL